MQWQAAARWGSFPAEPHGGIAIAFDCAAWARRLGHPDLWVAEEVLKQIELLFGHERKPLLLGRWSQLDRKRSDPQHCIDELLQLARWTVRRLGLQEVFGGNA